MCFGCICLLFFVTLYDSNNICHHITLASYRVLLQAHCQVMYTLVDKFARAVLHAIPANKRTLVAPKRRIIAEDFQQYFVTVRTVPDVAERHRHVRGWNITFLFARILVAAEKAVFEPFECTVAWIIVRKFIVGFYTGQLVI